MNNEMMLEVLKETRAILGLPENDFVYSGWDGADAAIAEIERWISQISEGGDFDTLDLRVLYAPTGPIQEVSVSSGWGKGFLELADRFDSALNYQAEQGGAGQPATRSESE